MEAAAAALAKSTSPQAAALAADLAARADGVRRFLAASAAMHSDPAGAVAVCQQLLAESGGGGGGGGGEAADGPAVVACVGTCVRPGDVFALLVEWCVSSGNTGQALALVQQMGARGLEAGRYLAPGAVEAVYASNGLAPPQAVAAAGGDGGVWHAGAPGRVADEGGSVSVGGAAAVGAAGTRRAAERDSVGGAEGRGSGDSYVQEEAMVEDLPCIGDAEP